MSLQIALARMAELQQMFAPQAVAQPTATSTATFASTMQATPAASAMTPLTAASPAGTPAGQAILNAIRPEVGVAEQPPGSNDGPRIAEYRATTAGSGVGPWCAYFTSWAAAQAGVPLGEAGQGFGSVSALYGWAQRTGRATPAGPGVHPNPGDLIVWGGEHIGIVESVDPDGSIHTIEGNSSNAVSRRTYGPDGGGATGYVHLG